MTPETAHLNIPLPQGGILEAKGIVTELSIDHTHEYRKIITLRLIIEK